MSEAPVRKHVIVSGRVQGVGYRYFVLENAVLMGIHGWVRNLPDGRVEAEIEGAENLVGELIKLLQTGPRLSVVTDLDVQDLAGSGSHKGFHVR
jgi:acylphosphatase